LVGKYSTKKIEVVVKRKERRGGYGLTFSSIVDCSAPFKSFRIGYSVKVIDGLDSSVVEFH
jgi:hypothetical protein